MPSRDGCQSRSLVYPADPWLNTTMRLIAIIALLGIAYGASLAAETNAVAEGRFVSNMRQLIFEGKRSGEGYFSPDGKALIFQSEREAENPFYQIYILSFESGDVHRVSPGTGKTTCAFFRPGSDEVLFASTHLDAEAITKQKAELEFRASGKQRRYAWDYDEHMEIFAARRDGSRFRQLTRSKGYDAEGAYSPDGRKIVFCSIRDAYPTNRLTESERKRFEADPSYFGEIYIMNADGSAQKRLTQTAGYDGGPFFSPDGKRIVWRRFDESGAIADVYTMAADGSDVRQVTRFESMSWAPYYHPSGRYLIFTSNKLGFSNFELHIVDAEGRNEPVRVTHTDGFDGLPVFSPDGKKLCWTSGRTADGKSQLFIGDWNHEAALAALQGGTDTQRDTAQPGRVPARQATFAPEIREADLRGQVEFLAADELEGRMTGTPGAKMAADFIADELKRIGLKPLSNDWFQSFQFTSGVRVLTNDNHLGTRVGSTAQTFRVEKDFRPLSFTANGTVEGPIVFAGYGLVVPGKEGYDSYAGINVSNKIVVALRYVPEAVEAKRRQELNRYAGLRYKAMNARERGAKAILFVTGPNSPNAGELIGLSSDSASGGSGIMAASVTMNVVAPMFTAARKDLKAVQSQLDKEDPHAEGGFVLSNVTVSLTTAVEHIRKMDRNVIGALPASSQISAEYILVGAHY